MSPTGLEPETVCQEHRQPDQRTPDGEYARLTQPTGSRRVNTLLPDRRRPAK